MLELASVTPLLRNPEVNMLHRYYPFPTPSGILMRDLSCVYYIIFSGSQRFTACGGNRRWAKRGEMKLPELGEKGVYHDLFQFLRTNNSVGAKVTRFHV